MIAGDQFVSIVKTYFDFLISEFRFRLVEQEIRSSVFYDVQYKDQTRVVSISYENIADYLLVIVFLLQDGKLPHYDDKTKTLHLNVLNQKVRSIIKKEEYVLNNEHFLKYVAKEEFERKLLKHAKELRLCLTHFDEIWQ